MATFTTTQKVVKFTDTDDEVSFAATTGGVTFSAAYQSVTGGGGASLSDATPQAPGVASAGVATTASRSDHVHPEQDIDVETAVEDYLIANPPTARVVHRVQGLLPADLDVTGGSFTTVDILGVDGDVLVDDLPRGFAVGSTGLIATGANAGVWTITASGACTETTVLGGELVSAFESIGAAAVFIGVNAAGPNGTLDPTAAATAFVREVPVVSWSTVTDKPARITSLESFVRPTVIFSRLHFGGDPVAAGESPLASWLNPATGEILAPIYNATNFPTPLPENHEDDGTPVGTRAYDNKPVIDGYPWGGGTILLADQGNWEANGPWEIVDDGGTWVAERPATLNGWVTDAMAIEGMPFWIGSGREHRLKVGAWFYDGIVPSSEFESVGFHRNDASDSYYTPADATDWDVTPTRCAGAHDEIADRVRDVENVYIPDTIVDAKGDLIVATAADTVARLPVGATNGHVLTVDSAEAAGVKWAAASGGGGGWNTMVGAQSAVTEAATDWATLGVNATLLGTAVTLPISAAGDIFEGVATVDYDNQSGATRQPRGGIRLGSTNCVSSEVIALGSAATGVVSRFVIRFTIHVLSATSQRLIVGFNTDRLTGSFGNHTAATEDFTGTLPLQVTFGTNNASGTQTATLQSLHVTKVEA